MADPQNVEIWKNTANGPRWYTVFDTQGREVAKTVQGGRTFTVTVFERRVNQDKVALPELDAFRNGTFILVRESSETDEREVESPNAKTDSELEQIVNETLADPSYIDGVLQEVSSTATLHRLLEFLVADDAPSSAIDKVRAAFHAADGGVTAVKRRMVTTARD